MKIYAKYLLQQLLKNFLILNTIIILIASLLQLMRYGSFLTQGISIIDLIDAVILYIPELWFMLLPLLTFFSVFYTYNYLAQKQELIILSKLGLNSFNMALPALIFSLIISALSFYIAIILEPSFVIKRITKLEYLNNSYVVQMLKENSFNDLSKNFTIYLGKKLKYNSFENILIFDKTKHSKIFIAQKGELNFDQDNLNLRLYNGLIQNFGQNATNTNMGFSQFDLKINLNTQKAAHNKKYSSLMDLFASADNKSIARAHKNILWPAYNFLTTFVLLAMFLHKAFLNSSDKAKIFAVLFLVIAIYFLFHILTIRYIDLAFMQYLWFGLVFLISLKLMLSQKTSKILS